jgi:hypothetical protein
MLTAYREKSPINTLFRSRLRSVANLVLKKKKKNTLKAHHRLVIVG